jgi:hypothetical protein
MAMARLPVSCANAGTMKKKWSKLQEDPDSYKEREPTMTWPEPKQLSQRAG